MRNDFLISPTKGVESFLLIRCGIVFIIYFHSFPCSLPVKVITDESPVRSSGPCGVPVSYGVLCVCLS